MNGVFDVSDHGVHPFEYFELIIFSAAVGNDGFVTALGVSDTEETTQAIGDNKTSWAEMLCGPC